MVGSFPWFEDAAELVDSEQELKELCDFLSDLPLYAYKVASETKDFLTKVQEFKSFVASERFQQLRAVWRVADQFNRANVSEQDLRDEIDAYDK